MIRKFTDFRFYSSNLYNLMLTRSVTQTQVLQTFVDVCLRVKLDRSLNVVCLRLVLVVTIGFQ